MEIGQNLVCGCLVQKVAEMEPREDFDFAPIPYQNTVGRIVKEIILKMVIVLWIVQQVQTKSCFQISDPIDVRFFRKFYAKAFHVSYLEISELGRQVLNSFISKNLGRIV